MSLKLRGEEVLVRISSDDTRLTGSLLKVKSFVATPRTDLTEQEYLGELESDLDIQHHGWDLKLMFDTTDDAAMKYTESVIQAEEDHTAHPNNTITVIYTFREPGTRGKIAVFHGVFLKQDEENVGGRKEIVTGSFSGKAKRRELMNA